MFVVVQRRHMDVEASCFKSVGQSVDYVQVEVL